MSRRLKIILAIVVFVALSAVGYTQRTRVMDTWRETERPSVPAVSFKDIKNDPPAQMPETESIISQPSAEPTPTPPNIPTPGNPFPEQNNPPPPSDSPTPSTLPASFNLAVPFTPQAPFANWDEVHEDACEEASIYMAHLFYEGVPAGRVDAQTAEDEILRLVEAEKKMFGTYLDTNAEETARLAKEFYGYKRVDLLVNPTVDDLKHHLVAGRPIVIPVAGQYIGNPYFTAPGPDYHMLLIRGYTKDGFLTNDPGTKRGEGYLYPYDTLMNAIHDWNPPNDILEGRKVVIVMYPN